MKKTFIKIISGIVSAIIILIWGQGCDMITNDQEATGPESDFAIKDTARIIKFIISDTENNSISISRDNKQGIWMIEGTDYFVQNDNVQLILETFYRIRIKQDVPKTGVENVISSLAVRHKKVEVFMSDEKDPVKTWYIGGPTQDHMGTYMLLQNGNNKSSIPFITYKPGVNGSLDVRFFTSWVDWKSSSVFCYPDPRKIRSIDVNFKDKPAESYTAVRKENGDVLLLDNNKINIELFDSSQVKHYLTHYKKIHYNRLENVNDLFIDSVFSDSPDYTITLQDNESKITKTEIWKMRMDGDYYDSNGLIMNWDPEHGYLRINDSKELFRIQYFSWDILFKPLSYYLTTAK